MLPEPPFLSNVTVTATCFLQIATIFVFAVNVKAAPGLTSPLVAVDVVVVVSFVFFHEIIVQFV